MFEYIRECVCAVVDDDTDVIVWGGIDPFRESEGEETERLMGVLQTSA